MTGGLVGYEKVRVLSKFPLLSIRVVVVEVDGAIVVVVYVCVVLIRCASHSIGFLGKITCSTALVLFGSYCIVYVMGQSGVAIDYSALL